MIQGGSGVVSCDCENPEFFLNLCLVLKQYSNIYLENIMELFVHRWQTAPSPGAITMVEVNHNILLGRTGEGSGHQRQCYNCGKVGIWPMCALLNIKLQQKRTKRKREKLYKLLTSLIQPYNLFYFY